MKFRPSIILLITTLLGVESCSFPIANPMAQQRPNVLLIMMDDMNRSLGCYGNETVKSPSIDRLAAKGIRFDRAYCQFPLCNPSRTSMLTGLRPETTGVMRNGTRPRKHLKDRLFMPEYFRQNGYFTAQVGKIVHAAFQDSVSWDVSESRESLGGVDNSTTPQCMGKKICATNNRDEDEGDGRVARRVIEILEQNRNKTFFISAGFSLPHLPWHAPRKYFDLYPPESIPLPEGPSNKSAEETQQLRAAYYACVSFIDAQIGLILDALDRLELTSRTAIVFTSDHGYLLGEHGGIFKKRKLYDEVARVPLILAVPGSSQGLASSRIVELVDIYPSLIDICSLPQIEDLEGTSFLPLLMNPDREWKKAAFGLAMSPENEILYRSVYTERYVYIGADGKKPELYDHQTDPHELMNVAEYPRYAVALAEMKKILSEGWRKALPPSINGIAQKTSRRLSHSTE